MLFFKTREHKNVIAENSIFTGLLQSDLSIAIKGKFIGRIKSKQEVYISDNASVDANIIAENLLLEGNLSGELNLQKDFEIGESAIFSGEITAQKIIFHKGADLKLEVNPDIAKNEEE